MAGRIKGGYFSTVSSSAERSMEKSTEAKNWVSAGKMILTVLSVSILTVRFSDLKSRMCPPAVLSAVRKWRWSPQTLRPFIAAGR